MQKMGVNAIDEVLAGAGSGLVIEHHQRESVTTASGANSQIVHHEGTQRGAAHRSFREAAFCVPPYVWPESRLGLWQSRGMRFAFVILLVVGLRRLRVEKSSRFQLVHARAAIVRTDRSRELR